ncbi:PH, RCC1 and FYVE domains-containing protein 1 isoform X1 [Ricinus communis]|uniref:PH, RCC1 and FYVE domains-containing protein 1 isoform X1 n=1 Tax=Ricinus communis TaxID=3988 RepID=UPI000772B8EA|nr:PH, RCC1 and FYVE domains-containing protein 1 isoform X1 [Ricinus communis]|eukprot:XP_015578623.1 PH, RCC1 and FYVE domains-containing protein 1 isoform X1 [Ricinus communis]
MADNTLRTSSPGRDILQAITAIKKGAYLLKYGRWGKPKFCPFRLSNDERFLIWYAGKLEKQLKLSHVSKIMPGQHTAIFQRYPQPEKEYQSFSLIYSNRSLDVICKDKVEAEVWIVALRALISQNSCCKRIGDPQSDANSPRSHARKSSLSNVSCTSSDIIYKDPEDTHPILVPYETSPQNRLGKAFSEVLSFTAAAKAYTQAESVARSLSNLSSGISDDANSHSSAVDAFRNSSSSAVSSSGYVSSHEDVDGPGDVLFLGEGISNLPLGGNMYDVKSSPIMRMDALLPKALDRIAALDAQIIACGSKHAVIVTKQGQIFSWGESSGGKLGHGADADVSQPKVIDALSESNVVLVACGEFHTCAVTVSGNLYTWGDDTHNTGYLGHGSAVSHWIPREVIGQIESVRISFVSCGPWHTAAVSSQGKLFTFGDGTFGALGHGDRSSTSKPREVESLKGLRTLKVSCGIWHTAAVIDFINESDRLDTSLSGKLFTWGAGERGQLGHGDEEPRLVPSCVSMPAGVCQVACAHSMTIALTVLGQVYTMGAADYGQLGSPCSVGKLPIHTDGDIRNCHIKQIACGSHHVVALSSNGDVYTWGKGINGQLGHGDIKDRHTPTLVKALKHKQVKSVVCGSNFTAVICPHKCVSSADQSICSGCHNPFNFRRKRHNCYNCGLLFCKACSSKRSLKAALAPNVNKPSRVCDECFAKLTTAMEDGPKLQVPKSCRGSLHYNCKEIAEAESITSNPSHQHCRLSSLDSFKQALRQNSQHNKKAESCQCHVSPTQIGSLEWELTYEYEDLGEMSASDPGSGMLSRATSPVSRRSSQEHSLRSASSFNNFAHAELLPDNSKQRNESLSQEILLLRGQVADLTHRSRVLEADIDRTSRQLKEATETVKKESEKNKVAKEIIRSLTAQLKDMPISIPEQCVESTKPGSFVEMTSIFLSGASREKLSTSATYLEYEYNGKLITPIWKSRSKKRSAKLETVMKDKPSMYVMRPPLPQVQFRYS